MTKSFLFGPFDAPITLADAITAHVNYLKDKDGPHVKNNGGEIIHCLRITMDDLEKLYLNATYGIRLYFCRHNPAKDELNIIVAPIGADGHNKLVDEDGASTLVNTLEPCPDKCPPLLNPINSTSTTHDASFSVKDLNHVILNNEGLWCKPNKRNGNDQIWFKADKTPVNDPPQPYVADPAATT